MTDQPDPREVKLLADILALVLENQPGQSATALDAIRRRAEASRVTGGALKNLFLRLTTPATHAEAAPAASQLERELNAAKLEIAELQSERTQLHRTITEAQSRYEDALEQRKSSTRIGVALGAVSVICAVAVLAVLGSVRTNTPTSTASTTIAAMGHPPAPAQAPAPPAAPASPPTPAATSAPAPPRPLRLAEDTRRAVAEHVRSCWMQGEEAAHPAHAAFDVQVQIDESGTIRDARLTGADETARSDPAFRSFADQAVHALLDPRCATLPLPLGVLGHRTVLDFHFAP